MRTGRPHLLLVTMSVGYFLVLLDVSALTVALPLLRLDLHAGTDSLSAVVAGYAVPFAALLLLAGAAGDRLGHLRLVRFGLAGFGVASLACALAPTVAVLLAARVAQGTAAAVLLPGTLAVVTAAHGGGRRPRAIGVWAAVGGLGLPAGPLLGGVLAQAVGWRAVFWLNVPVVAAALLATRRLAPTEVRAEAGTGTEDAPGCPPRSRSRRAAPDLPGAVLGTASLGLLAGAAAGRSAVTGVVAAAVLCAFVAVERRAADPLLPLALFRRHAFVGSTAAAFVMNAGSQGLLFLTALLLQGVWGLAPAVAGLAVLPSFGMLVAVPPVAGWLVARRGPVPVQAAGLAVAAVGVALLALPGARPRYPTLLPALCVWGLGLGLLTPAVVAGAVGAVPPERTGLAAAVNNAARQAGNAVGVPVCAAVAGPVGGSFLGRMHAVAFGVAVLYTATAVAVTRLALPRRAGARRSVGPARGPRSTGDVADRA